MIWIEKIFVQLKLKLRSDKLNNYNVVIYSVISKLHQNNHVIVKDNRGHATPSC
jgi:hypothetical protein